MNHYIIITGTKNSTYSVKIEFFDHTLCHIVHPDAAFTQALYNVESLNLACTPLADEFVQLVHVHSHEALGPLKP